ncbi:MAG: TlpA disulfide reductase family protein [Methylovirgula sp.]|jgi:thiol-disulfide isomerase/thioredoxin
MEEKEHANPSEASDWMPFPAPLIPVVLVAGAVAFLYASGAIHRNEAQAPQAQTCTAARDVAARLKPLVQGEVAALAIASDPKPMPELTFSGPDGKEVKLSDFHGRDILLNLWATWCIPCRKEMPALDRLQGERGGPDFQVVAVNIDTAKLDRPRAFLNEIGVKNLTFYADSKADVFETLKQNGKVLGLPTSILVGKDGCALGVMAGPAQWDSKDAIALINAAKG